MSGQYPRQPSSNPNIPYGDPRSNPNWPYLPGTNPNPPYPPAQGYQTAGRGYAPYPSPQPTQSAQGYGVPNMGYAYASAPQTSNTASYGQSYPNPPPAQAAYPAPMNPSIPSGYYGTTGEGAYAAPGAQMWTGQGYSASPPDQSDYVDRSSTGSNSSPRSSGSSSQGSGDPSLEAKRLRNTVSARRGRARKLDELESLQTQVNSLRGRVHQMEADKTHAEEELAVTNAAVSAQRGRISQHMRELDDEEGSAGQGGQ